MTGWLSPALLLLPLSLAAQEDSAFITAIGSDPNLTLASEVVHYDADRSREVFGPDFETVADYGVRGLTDFAVATGETEVPVRITEMVDSAAAFGLFTWRRDHDRQDYRRAVVGTEGYSISGRTAFWQASFLIELDGPPDTALLVGRALSETITAPSRKPPVSASLPSRGLVADSERYIVSASVLETDLGLDPTLLGFDNDVEMAIATYQEGPERATLALLSYPTPQLARLYSEAWLEAVVPPGPTRRSGLLFGIVTSTNSGDLSDAILSELTSQFDVTWEEPPRDPLTIQQIILTAFAWIGIALLFTVAAGLGMGGLRIYMKTRYAPSLFGEGEAAGAMQLNLHQRVTGDEARSEDAAQRR